MSKESLAKARAERSVVNKAAARQIANPRIADPLQKYREKLLKDKDRKVRYLGAISDGHPPVSARIRADPDNPVQIEEIAVWVKVGSYEKRLRIAEEYGQAKVEFSVWDQVVGARKRQSALMARMLLEFQGRTVTQVRKAALEGPAPGTPLLPDKSLEGLSTAELEAQLQEFADAESDQPGAEGIGSEGADEAAAG